MKGIRKASLAMLDRPGDHDMPLDCIVTEQTVKAVSTVKIEVDDVIHVRPKK